MALPSQIVTASADSAAAPRSTFVTRRPTRAWRVLRTGAAFVTFGLGAIVVSGLVWLGARGNGAQREQRAQRIVHRAFALFGWWMARLGLIRARWVGAERLHGPGPRLYVANHPTLIDVVLLLARLPQAYCIVKTAARRNPLMRGIVARAGYLANDEGDALVDACATRLAQGRSVLLFPEGTRSPRGGLRRFQRGAAHIALRSGCPIVPIIITCRPPTLSKGQPWYDVPDRRAQFVLRVGEAIDPARWLAADTTTPVAARRLTAELQTRYERWLGADEDDA